MSILPLTINGRLFLRRVSAGYFEKAYMIGFYNANPDPDKEQAPAIAFIVCDRLFLYKYLQIVEGVSDEFLVNFYSFD
jgi:hypothetical protein